MASSTLKKKSKAGAQKAPEPAELVEHSSRLHALCSASGSERWLNCPGSVGLSRTVPEEPASEAALQGTRCHELAEEILKHWERAGRKIEDWYIETQRRNVRDTRDEATGWDMVDYAMTYVNSCIATIEEEFDKGTPVSYRLEHRLTFNADMKMFGTADFFATGTRNGRAHGVICDLKYGKKRVRVEDNSQLAFYAVALKKASKKNLETIKVRVVQPRIGHWLSEVEYTADELNAWDERLTLGAEKALIQIGSSHPELKTGGWCFFCAARDVCPAKANEAADCFDKVTDDDAGIFG
jgi:hypothetical protein